MNARNWMQNHILATSFLAAIMLLICGCGKAPTLQEQQEPSFDTNPLYGTPLPQPQLPMATYVPPTPFPTPIYLGGQIGLTGGGLPLAPIAPPNGYSPPTPGAFFQVVAGQTVELNLGITNQNFTGAPIITAGSTYQVIIPSGAGVNVVTTPPPNDPSVTCLPPQGTLTGGAVCLQFTQGTQPGNPIPITINVTPPGASQSETGAVYVAVQEILSPPIGLLRTCGRVSRTNSVTVQSPSLILSFEVPVPGGPPLLLLNIQLNNYDLYDSATVLPPAQLDLEDVEQLPGYLSLPVTINACVGNPATTSCLTVCTTPSTLSQCASRGLSSLATSPSNYVYQQPTTQLASFINPPPGAPPYPIYLLSNHAPPANVPANSQVVGDNYCDLVSPLALSFHPGFPQTNMTTDLGPVFFDINANGQPAAMDFLNDKEAAFLALPDQNGNISSGAQLFGPASTDLTTGKPGSFANGFVALSQYVPQGRTSILPSDPIWSQLRLWFPNGNPNADPGSLFTLDQMQVVELSLNDKSSTKTNSAGDAFKELSFFEFINNLGATIKDKFVDIWFTSY